MKKFVFVCLILIIGFSLSLSAEDGLKGKKIGKYPFYVYLDKGDKLNHFFPSGWMGDYGDIKVNDQWKDKPQSGKSCLQIRYTAERKQGSGWAGIYWQNPAGNWGVKKGGFDFTGAKKTSFYARGEKGGEIIEYKIGGITGDYPDSATVSGEEKITLTKEWKVYTLSLADNDLTYISGGFCVVFSGDDNPDGFTIYLDNILYADK